METSLATVTTDRWEIVGSIASTVNAITSLVAISFVAIQLKSSNRIAQAQLINELERDIALYTDVYVNLGMKQSTESEQSIELTEVDRIGILKCISFFERVHLILDTKVVNIATIDRTFAGRFFILFNNPKVRELMNTDEMSPYMTSIHELYHKWYNYRKEQELPLTIPLNGFQDILR
jgi:hypothetical protein